MIHKLISLSAILAIIAMTGALWSLIAVASSPAGGPVATVVTTGTAMSLALIGIPVTAAFLYGYSRPRGRHATPITRSAKRYIKPRVWSIGKTWHVTIAQK